MILNKGRVYYLNSYTKEKELRTDHFIWSHYDDYKYTNMVIGLEFGNSDVLSYFPLDTLITEFELAKIKNKQARLILVNSHEAFHYIIKDIYDHIILKYDIDPDQVTLCSESADIKTYVRSTAETLNLKPFKTIWTRRFEFDVQCNKRIMMKDSPSELKTLELKNYDKKYLFFIRRWRFHRPLLVALLKLEGVLDLGHVSLGKSDDNRDWNRFWALLEKYKELLGNDIHQNLNLIKDDILSTPDMYLDTDDLTINRAILTNSTDYLYEQTYFSVVGETNFLTRPGFESGRFLSEKTFKPVAQKHPFIIVSVPCFLDKFRDLGYKSFSPFIDESYDTELEDGKRILKIAQEIKRLSLLKGKELEEYLIGCKEICQHNYELLMNRQNFITPLD